MIKVFLSHSSKDKANYIEQVVSKLKMDNLVYDRLTFEGGMKNIDEIFSGIDDSSIFVVFSSEHSLKSEWVKKELTYANTKLSQGEIDRIYPIIIDENISYNNPLIPDWMKEEYNLRLVARPVVSARKIQQRLRELSWKKHPILKKRKNIFVGRNELVRNIEERMDDFDNPTPSIINASGLKRIGRSSLLKKSIEKCSIVDTSYESPHVILSNGESIEDLILKIYDLGFSSERNVHDLFKMKHDDKIILCSELIEDLKNSGEILLIHDDGCLIDYKGDIQEWFNIIANKMQKHNKLQWIIASTRRVFPPVARSKDYIYCVNVPELTIAERKGLFRRVLQIYDVELSSDDLSKFSELLTGFPEQVFFLCEQIVDLGIEEAWKHSHEITNFNTERASIILSGYSGNKDILDFIYLLSKFEFISHKFLFSIEERGEFIEILQDLITRSICDYVGSDKEFIRLNDSIRDYIQRNRLEIPSIYKKKLEDHLKQFIESPDAFSDDLSDISYSIKESIKAGATPPEKYLIPSHYLKNIRELYHYKKQLNKVIELSNKFLENEDVIDNNIVQDVRYYLCLALARKRDKRFLEEVHKIQGPEHDFLMGFYYRLTNRPKESIERFNKCLTNRVVENRAKRELVQVLIYVGDFQAAASLAKDNYEEFPNNPYHIQAYLNTLIHANHDNDNDNEKTILNLIDELKNLGTDVSLEMAEIAIAEYLDRYKNNYNKAKETINDAVYRFKESHYPLLTQAFLAAKNGDLETLEKSYEKIKEISSMRNIGADTLHRLEAEISALKGNIERAIRIIKTNLINFPEKSLDEIINGLKKSKIISQVTRL